MRRREMSWGRGADRGLGRWGWRWGQRGRRLEATVIGLWGLRRMMNDERRLVVVGDSIGLEAQVCSMFSNLELAGAGNQREGKAGVVNGAEEEHNGMDIKSRHQYKQE